VPQVCVCAVAIGGHSGTSTCCTHSLTKATVTAQQLTIDEPDQLI